MRFIPTRAHGVLDYTTAVGLLALPRALGLQRDVGRLLAGAGLVTVLYSILTRYELGLVPVLPMKAHLAIDMGSGAMMCAAPVVLDVDEPEVRNLLLAIGVFELVVPMLSKTKTSA